MVPSPVGAMEIAPGPGTSLPAMPCAPDTQQVFGVGVGEPEHMPPHWLAMPFALSTDQVFGVGNHEPMPSHVPAMPCAPSTDQVLGVENIEPMPIHVTAMPCAPSTQVFGVVSPEHMAHQPAMPCAPSTDQVFGVGGIGPMPSHVPVMPCAPSTHQVFGVGNQESMPSHVPAMPCAPSTHQVFGVGNHEPMPIHVTAMPCAPSTQVFGVVSPEHMAHQPAMPCAPSTDQVFGVGDIGPMPSHVPVMPCAPSTHQVFGVGNQESMPSHVPAMPCAPSTHQVFGVGNHEPMPIHVTAMPCAPSTQVFGVVSPEHMAHQPAMPCAPSTDQVFGVGDIGPMPSHVPVMPCAPSTHQVFGVGNQESMPSHVPAMPCAPSTDQVFGVGDIGPMPSHVPVMPCAPSTHQVFGVASPEHMAHQPAMPFAPSTDQVFGVGDIGPIPSHVPVMPCAPSTDQVFGVGDIGPMPSHVPVIPCAPSTHQVFGVGNHESIPSHVPAMPCAPSTDQVFGVGNHESIPSHVLAMPCAPSTDQVFGVGNHEHMAHQPAMPCAPSTEPMPSHVPAMPCAPSTHQVFGAASPEHMAHQPAMPFAPSTDQVFGVGDIGPMPSHVPVMPCAPSTHQVFGVGNHESMPSHVPAMPCASSTDQVFGVGNHEHIAHQPAMPCAPMFGVGGIGPMPSHLPAMPCAPSTDQVFGVVGPEQLFGQASVDSNCAASPSRVLDANPAAQLLGNHEVHRYLEDSQIMCMEAVPPGVSEALQPEATVQKLQQIATVQSSPQPAQLQLAAQQKPQDCKTIVRPSGDQELPFRVAAVKLVDDKVLAAHVGDKCSVEWDWGRAVNAVGMKTKKEAQYLRRNKELHSAELIAAAIPQAEIMYKGDGAMTFQGVHCVGSRALMLLLLLLTSSRQLAPVAKEKALTLAMSLLQLAVKTLSTAESFMGEIYVKNKGYLYEQVSVDSTGIVKGFSDLIQKHPAALWAWGHLMQHAFCSVKISSSSSMPTLWDLLLLLAWAKNNPATKAIWKTFGQLLWPHALWVCGRVLDSLALERASRPLDQLPLLKTRLGKAKRVHWVNKLLLLRKLRQTKHHRKNTMQSHSDLVPKNANIVSSEQWISTALYAQKVKNAYQEAYHYTIHWDPSGYDVETLVSIIFSTQAGDGGLAAYLPIQNLKPVLRSEVCEEIQALSAKHKLTRVSGFSEIRAVSNSLKAVGMPLDKFFLGQDVWWKPLQEFESRAFHDGMWYIVNSRTNTKVVQIPPSFDIAKTPILTSVSDQGGINRAGLDYLAWKLGMSLHLAFDPYHRSWNDYKAALKSSKGDMFKCLLAYSLLYNVNYGPFNSKGWHEKKKQRVQELLESGSAHKEPFLSFIPWICLERQIDEPTTASEREALFQSMADLNSIKTLGPTVKLMRFYSFFQSEKFYHGEVWCTKLLMLETDKFTVTDGTNFVRTEESLTLPDSGISDKEQLRQLKMKHGSWGLAPLLVTPASFWQKNALVELGRPCWSAHASMCQNILTPTQFANHTIAQCQGGWKQEILELVLQGFFQQVF